MYPRPIHATWTQGHQTHCFHTHITHISYLLSLPVTTPHPWDHMPFIFTIHSSFPALPICDPLTCSPPPTYFLNRQTASKAVLKPAGGEMPPPSSKHQSNHTQIYFFIASWRESSCIHASERMLYKLRSAIGSSDWPFIKSVCMIGELLLICSKHETPSPMSFGLIPHVHFTCMHVPFGHFKSPPHYPESPAQFPTNKYIKWHARSGVWSLKAWYPGC